MCWLGVQVAFSLSFKGKYHLGGLGVFSVLQRWSFDGPEVIQQRGYVLAVSAGSLFASKGNIILRVQWFLFSLFFLCLFLKIFLILLSCSCSLSDRISVFYQKKKKEAIRVLVVRAVVVLGVVPVKGLWALWWLWQCQGSDNCSIGQHEGGGEVFCGCYLLISIKMFMW